jgi:pyridoxamine 5'-phosphate oxidase
MPFWEPPAGAPEARIERTLDERSLAADPLVQLTRWLSEATEAAEPFPHAMALATASAEGVPAVRMVLLDRVDERGCLFQTNVESPKAHDLAATGRAALVFFWPSLLRQVRVTGPVARVPQQEVQALFDGTPTGIQAMLRACRQGQVIGSRAELERGYAEALREQGMPADWGGFRVGLEMVEFWQGRANRLQDRLRFTRAGDAGWQVTRLMP